MNENAPAGAAEQSQTPSPAEPQTGATSLSAEIADRIKGSTDVVRQKLLGRYADKEIDNRVNLLEKGFEQVKTIKTALNRVKPDIVHYDENKKPIHQAWTKPALEAKEKIEQGHKKLDAALTAAINNEPGAFDKLKEAIEKTKSLAEKGSKPEAAPAADAEA
jgi:hypothetical protein